MASRSTSFRAIAVPGAATGIAAVALLAAIIGVSTMSWSVTTPESNVGAYVGLFEACSYRIKIGSFVISTAQTCWSLNEPNVGTIANSVGSSTQGIQDLYIGIDASRGLVVAALVVHILSTLAGLVITALPTKVHALLAIPGATAILASFLYIAGLGVWAGGVHNRGLSSSPMLSVTLGYSFGLTALACILTLAAAGTFFAAVRVARENEKYNSSRGRRRMGSALDTAPSDLHVALDMANPHVPSKRLSMVPVLVTTVRGGLLDSNTASHSSGGSNPGDASASGSSEGPSTARSADSAAPLAHQQAQAQEQQDRLQA